MSAYSWGFNKYGQLGNGQNSTAETPQFVEIPKPTTPLQISCGGHYTLILCEKLHGNGSRHRKLFACGWGKNGRLGTGSEDDRNIPNELIIQGTPLHISAGLWHAACVTDDGELHTWGYNKSHNVLGLIEGSSPLPSFEAVPIRVLVDRGVKFKHVSCGFNYAFAVSEDGCCWSWGSGAHGVLGHGDTHDRTRPTRVDIPGGDVISLVACGYSHVAMVSIDGKLLMAGYGHDGALGLGNKLDQNRLCQVRALADVTIDNVSCSLGERHSHTLACARDGYVYSWGDGYKGKLGLGDQESRALPTKVNPVHFGGACVKSVACGGIHSAAVTRVGDVFTWGCGSDGRLGHPEGKGHRYLFRSDVPKRVEGLPKNLFFVDCSYYHTAVLTSVA